MARGREAMRRVADKEMTAFKQRARLFSRRVSGCRMAAVVQTWRSYLLGLKVYFGLAQTLTVWRELDEWLRHRLRAIQLKPWWWGKNMYRELLAMGAKLLVARGIAANSRRWWRNSAKSLNGVLTIA